jgi:hypothetical protein
MATLLRLHELGAQGTPELAEADWLSVPGRIVQLEAKSRRARHLQKQMGSLTSRTASKMPTRSMSEIVKDISGHIMACGAKSYSDWYAGIASDSEERLFYHHNVSKENDSWIRRKARNVADARAAAAELHDMGCGGVIEDGDEEANYVYAYEITETTIQ